MLSGKRILLGVTGGIAAYKSVYLLREFQKAGAKVRVTMTPAATRFVGTETFAALSRHEVAVEVFSENEPDE
ncbi:MAG: bifunctional phosphopantothenoylcysteine decarboxylase/phosphopantothenate--cysteine ligase CoaBC, partial [Bacteroidetes bacterium]|nr:bifunctional phosphopantothenoylcysteine decarboxylase/phosphopantothenate--cysteine ligase CoaBC [Bacteroidota bacterium]